jgi:cell division protein FtsL
MFQINLYIIILVIFLLFIFYQIYFYREKYIENNKLIKKIENFESTLKNINHKKDYLLDDKSIEILLEDYNQLKKNT